MAPFYSQTGVYTLAGYFFHVLVVGITTVIVEMFSVALKKPLTLEATHWFLLTIIFFILPGSIDRCSWLHPARKAQASGCDQHRERYALGRDMLWQSRSQILPGQFGQTCQVRAYIQKGDLKQAALCMEEMQNSSLPSLGFIRNLQSITRAQILLAGDQVFKALAAPEGFVRIFLDEGGSFVKLLSSFSRSKGERIREYVAGLLSAFQQEEKEKLVGKAQAPRLPYSSETLNERESQILSLIAEGKSYQEIAQILIIAVSTVQHYIKSLYAKLQVHSGLEAVAHARHLGLLP